MTLTNNTLGQKNGSYGKSLSMDDELYELTWNEILHDGGLATWTPRLSFRWLTITICIVGVLGKNDRMSSNHHAIL
jgi:hypothetical protein